MELKNRRLFRQQCFINGQWTSAEDGRTFPVYNPANGKELGSAPLLSQAQTAQAIEAARLAWPIWKALSPADRATILHRWHDCILENTDDLAKIMTLEQGKPLAEAKGEIANALGYITWFAEEARRAYGEVIPPSASGKQPLTIRQPIGVTAAITPWNFPFGMIVRKASPALAAGCPMVIKPATKTPYSALALAELADQAGIPAGVFSVVTGEASVVGAEICANPTVRKLSFTGSTAVGKKLIAACAPTVKKLSLELGGNAPLIVCADADLDLAVAGALGCKFRNSGQTCICVNRILVYRGIHDEFVEKLKEQAQKIVLGDGLQAGVTQGPMINNEAHANMQELVDDALAKGAKVVLGGKAGEGLFYPPTILTEVTPEMRVFREEIFGPIAPIVSFENEEEAVTLANDTQYGLASYVFTRNLKSFYRISTALEFGMVGVNEVTLASNEVPFGGVKESGIGREGGWQGLEGYLETKYILLGGL